MVSVIGTLCWGVALSCSLLLSIVASAPVQPPRETVHKLAQKEQKKKGITITNTIKRDDIGYYKYFMNHYPKEFKVVVNGTQLDKDETLQLEQNTKKIDVQYKYTWYTPWGDVCGGKQLTCISYGDAQKIDISFDSWDSECRINVSNTTLVQLKELDFGDSEQAREKLGVCKQK